MSTEAQKVRVVLMIEEECRDALRLEAALESNDMGDVVSDLIRKHLTDALARIRERRTKQEKSKHK